MIDYLIKDSDNNFNYTGIALVFGKLTDTNRRYDYINCKYAIDIFKAKVKNTQILGQINHPEILIDYCNPIRLENASHIIEDIFVENLNSETIVLKVKIKTLPTVSGQLLQSLYKSNIKLYISLMGTATLDISKNIGIVNSDLELITFNVIQRTIDSIDSIESISAEVL